MMLQVSVEHVLQLQGDMVGLEMSPAKVGMAVRCSQRLVDVDRAMQNRNPATRICTETCLSGLRLLQQVILEMQPGRNIKCS